jgi:hypothetical protein
MGMSIVAEVEKNDPIELTPTSQSPLIMHSCYFAIDFERKLRKRC